MKRILIKIELVEDKKLSKPVMVSNVLIFPVKDGYEFYYEENDLLTKLYIKSAKIIEVAQLDDVQQLLLEGKMSESEKNVLRQEN